MRFLFLIIQKENDMETQNESFFKTYWFFFAFGGFVLVALVSNLGIPLHMIIVEILIFVGMIPIGKNYPKWRAPIAIFLIIMFVGSAWVEFENRFKLPIPTINIDNSTDLYPMPENPNPAQQETLQWMEGKWVIGPGAGAAKVAVWTEGAAVIAMLILAFWAFIAPYLPKKIQMITIPIQLVLAIVFGIILTNYIGSPINTDGMDYNTRVAADIVWFGGFLQNKWWPMVISGISALSVALKKGAARAGIPILITVVTACTWLLLPIITTIFNPTMIAWKSCSLFVSTTMLTNALCQEFYASGNAAMLIAVILWGFISALIAEFFGFSSGDDD